MIARTGFRRASADKKLMRTLPARHVPSGAIRTMIERKVRPTRLLLTVSVSRQAVTLWEMRKRDEKTAGRSREPQYDLVASFVASTSRFGIGQRIHSNRTPLGLHRIARKIGGDQPEGTVFKSRIPIGHLSDMPDAAIVHRILWLAGLEPGRNQGGDVDTFRRFIYIHGFGDESSLGRPASSGCIHLAAADLIPLYERVSTGTLVWIGR